MVFLIACLLGSTAVAFRSLRAIIIVGVSLPILFAASAMVSASVSFWLLLSTIAGLNAGVMLPIGLLMLKGRARRLT